MRARIQTCTSKKTTNSCLNGLGHISSYKPYKQCKKSCKECLCRPPGFALFYSTVVAYPFVSPPITSSIEVRKNLRREQPNVSFLKWGDFVIKTLQKLCTKYLRAVAHEFHLQAI